MSNDNVFDIEKWQAEQLIKQRCEEGLGMTERMASFLSRDRRGALSPDELLSVGYIALRRAAERFDVSKQIPFTAYAYKWVRGAMLKALREEHRITAAVREAGYRALAVLDDDGDPLESEEQHSQRLDEYCDALLVSMVCGAVSKASADDSAAREMGFAERDGTMMLRLLPRAIAMLDEDKGALIRLHWLEEQSLHQISREQGISYMTLRRRHQQALISLARVLKRLLVQCMAH